MSEYDNIRATKTCIDREQMREWLDSNCRGAHESILRAYQILQKAKQLLRDGVPAHVVLELIEMMEELPEANQ